MTSMMYDYLLFALAVIFVISFVRLLIQKVNLHSVRWLAGAFLCWPLYMTDEWLRLAGATQFAPLYGLSEVFAVVAVTCCYRAIRPLLVAVPSVRKRLWWPTFVTATVQLSVLFIPSADKATWFTASPVGEPLYLWPAYLPSLFTSFSVLLIGILIAEHIQHYHRYLPLQAVDIKPLKAPRLAAVIGSLVGIAFVSILLITAVMFGFLKVLYWESLHHMMIGASLVTVLCSLTFIRNTLPSPIDYKRLDEEKASPYEISSMMSKAARYVTASQAFRKRGLTLEAFCAGAKLEPTQFAIALQVNEVKTFQRFIYNYRIEFAQHELIIADSRLAVAAKSMGIDSEKFLSERLHDYLD